MSTKIHHGYRLTGPTDPLAVIPRLRAAMAPAGAELTARATAAEVARAIDAARLQRPLSDLSPLLHAIGRIRRDWADHDRHDCEIVFLPDPVTGDRYALLYDRTHDHTMTGIWEGLGIAQPWPYWNNSDRPDDIDDAQWARRARTWDRVLGNDPPSTRGLTWRLHPAGPPAILSPDTILAHLPDDHARATAIAQLLLINDLTAQGHTTPAALGRALVGHDAIAHRAQELLGRIRPIVTKDLTAAPVSAQQDTMGT